MRRHLALLAAPFMVAAVCTAYAAPFPGFASAKVSGGNAAVAACDDAFTPTYTTSGGKVTTVTIGGIADPACEGGAVRVTVTAGGSALGSGGPVTIPTDGDTTDNSVAVPLSPQPDAWLIDGIAVVVTGP